LKSTTVSVHASTVELSRSFRRGFAVLFGADLVTKVFGAATVVVLIRGLSVSAYAYTTLFLTVAQFAGSAAGGGVRTRYLREEAERQSRGLDPGHYDLFVSSLMRGSLLIAAIGICALPVVALLHPGSKFGGGIGLVVYATAFSLGFAATELAMAHYQAARRFGAAGVLGIVRAAALLAAAVMISVTSANVSILSVWFVASMIAVGLATALPIARGGRQRGAHAVGLFAFSREESWLSLYYLVAAGFAYVDVLVATALLSTRQVATLGASLRYLALVMGALPALGAILRVRTAQVDLLDSVERQRDMIMDWLRRTVVPTCIVAGLGIALSPWAIPLIDRGKYPGSIVVLQIFLVTAVSAYVTAPGANMLMAQRRYATLAYIFGAGLVVNLVGDVFVARKFGVTGIAVVSSVAYVAIDVMTVVESLRHSASTTGRRR
jgi:O-antigen/teichoic acid export membrane protein